MIKEFNEVAVRQSGVVYDGSWDQIKMLYAMDPQKAGELAISVIELTLTGRISSDDPMIKMLLATVEKVVKKDTKKYNDKVAAQETKKLERLTQIADLYNRGMSQKEIAEVLGKSPSTISGDMTLIRTEYPYLLSEKFGKFEKFGTDNDTVTDNVNDNVTVTDTDNVAKPMLAEVNSYKTKEDRRKSLMAGLM